VPEVQALGLNDPALTIVVQVIAVAQYTRDVAAEGALQAGEHAAAAVEAGSGDVEVTVLGDDAPALVVDGTTGFYCQIALALQAAFGVVEAGGIQVRPASRLKIRSRSLFSQPTWQ
jgi:DUF4097 and DUF4098 domain-containing protein YvlB